MKVCLIQWFQSSPGQKAGCNSRPAAPCFPACGCFNPHPARRPGATPIRAHPEPHGNPCFNPHPARRPGATVNQFMEFDRTFPVSILTRPEGRVQPDLGLCLGCPLACFNPHPARRPGATVHAGQDDAAQEHVSILTRPEGRVQQCDQRVLPFIDYVSILTRPEGRVQPSDSLVVIGVIRHVSILTRPEGRVQLLMPASTALVVRVSILTRPEGRVQHREQTYDENIFSFNPHPARRPGATPSPHLALPAVACGFNPHPARRPGATAERSVGAAIVPVSILTRPEGRVQRGWRGVPVTWRLLAVFQSSPGQKAGCNSCI